MSLPALHWTIDGRSVGLQGFRATAVVDGGYDRMTGLLSERTYRANREAIDQEAVVRAYDDAGSSRWYGRISKPPSAKGGLVGIEARGPMQEAEAATDFLLYQTRDYRLWAPRDAEIHNYGNNEKFSGEVDDGRMIFTIRLSEAYVACNRFGHILWVPNSTMEQTITRVAFTITKTTNQPDFELEVRGYVGPTGAGTTLATYSLSGAGPATVDLAFVGTYDQITIDIHCAANNTPTVTQTTTLTNLRVNGIAVGDEMFSSDIAVDMGGRLKWDARGVVSGGVNALPFYLHSGNWALDGLSYLMSLTDWRWLALEERETGKGPWLDVGPWAKEWTVLRSRDAAPELDALPVYNRVVVKYTTTAGAPAEILLGPPTPDPLAGRAVTRPYVFQLNDPQPDSVLATNVAQVLLDQVSQVRRFGRIDIVGARDEAGLGHAYAVLPGSLALLADHDDLAAERLRVWEVAMHPEGATLGIESPVTVDGLIHLQALEAARAA